MCAAFSKLTTLLELKHAASINDYVNLSLNSFLHVTMETFDTKEQLLSLFNSVSSTLIEL